MSRPFVSRLPIPMYRTTLVLSVGKTAEAGSKRIKKNFPHDCTEYEGLTVSKDGDVAVILGIDRMSLNTLVHEVFHATHAIMERCEPLDRGHHEPYAYLCGWLADWVASEVRRHGIRIR